MKNLLIRSVCIFSVLFHVAPAFSAEATKLSVSRLGDTEMGCGQLSQEAALMRDIVLTTEDIKEDTEIRNYGITAAGALGSLLVSSVTGGAGIAAAGFLLKQTTSETSEEADDIQDIAKQRRSLMVGIYNAKGCAGPMEHAFQDGADGDALALELAAIHPQAGSERGVDKSLHLNQ